MQPIEPMQPIETMQGMQSIYLNGWDSVLSVKGHPCSQLTQCSEMQPIHLHGGGGDLCSQLKPHIENSQCT